MPTTQCPDILAFVEGTMERIFLNSNFSSINVIPILNGNSWNTQTLCAQIITKFKARKQFPGQIVVWMDREDNPDSILVIGNAIRSAFSGAGFPPDKVHCLISDKMCENLMLADESMIRQELAIPQYVYQFEGQNGKHHMKELWKQRNKNYKETIHGSNLLKKMRLSRARSLSGGVDQFLGTFQSNCWWL